MRSISRARFAGLLVGLVALAVGGMYLWDFRQLAAARQARQDDDYARAERHLGACWPLPGMARVAALEDELLAVQQGDLAREEHWQQRAKSPAPGNLLILEALAKGNLATFQYNEARNYAEQILERQPHDWRAHWLRGRAWVRLQQEGRGRADFESALQTEPEAFEVRLSLADLLHKLGHVREAIAHYQRLRRERPGEERVALALAHCWQEEGRPREALAILDRLLKQSRNSVPAMVERGRLALRMGEAAVAEKWLRTAIEINPDHAEANAVLQLALAAQEKTDADLVRRSEANERRQAELRLQLHENGSQPALLTDLGQWVMRTGDEREAAGWLYAAVKEDPGSAPAHVALAEYFGKTGQIRRAKLHAQLGGGEPTWTPNSRGARSAAEMPMDRDLDVVDTAHPVEATTEAVRRLCAACHAYPPPETFPRSAWRKEVKQGYDFLRLSALAGDFPPLESVVQYYEARAAERLPAIEQSTAATPPPVKFEKRGTGWMVHLPPYPGVANVQLCQLLGSRKQELLLCDTRLDRVLVVKPYETTPGGDALPQVIAPCHVAAADLDGDGRQDVLVASLGNFFPTDDRVGKVIWLRNTGEGRYEARTLCEGVGRVADVQAADFNGDGRLDLIVGVFGWRTMGEVFYLENRTTDWSRPEFARHEVDGRHGAIHVPVADLNADGRPDFVTLISQEHETVVACLNQGDSTFRKETIFTAPHPTFGSSGIELVDLDGDGDLDVLMTNGDVLDRPYLLKPYHGVQWLENEGTYPFRQRLLSPLYGAARAVAADFDLDGDQDVAAVSFLPRLEFPDRESLRLPSVVLFEQTEKRQFTMHVLETGACDHFTCAAGDWDSDGKVDLAVGNFSWKRSQAIGDAAVLWRNMGRPDRP